MTKKRQNRVNENSPIGEEPAAVYGFENLYSPDKMLYIR